MPAVQISAVAAGEHERIGMLGQVLGEQVGEEAGRDHGAFGGLSFRWSEPQATGDFVQQHRRRAQRSDGAATLKSIAA